MYWGLAAFSSDNIFNSKSIGNALWTMKHQFYSVMTFFHTWRLWKSKRVKAFMWMYTVQFTSCWPWWFWLGLTAAEPLKMAMFSPKKRLKVGALFEVGINVHMSQNMGQKPRVSNKSNTWFWWMSIDVDSSTTLSLKQNSYWQTTCNGRKMPKKFLIYVFLSLCGPRMWFS